MMDKKALSHACLHQDFKGHQIEQKHGEIPIRILRDIYGPGFAPAFYASHRLRHTLALMDRRSLDKLLADQQNGVLDSKIEMALLRDATTESAPASGLDWQHS
jgi:hypothetical protein